MGLLSVFIGIFAACLAFIPFAGLIAGAIAVGCAALRLAAVARAAREGVVLANGLAVVGMVLGILAMVPTLVLLALLAVASSMIDRGHQPAITPTSETRL